MQEGTRIEDVAATRANLAEAEQALATVFIVTVLSLGLLISTIGRTQLHALQMSFMILLPSVIKLWPHLGKCQALV